MGLIKNIFGAILGVIGGVLKAIFGIFGIGKQSEYYLEADDADGGSKPQEQPQAAVKKEKPAAPSQASTPAPAKATKSQAPAEKAKPKAAPVAQPVPVQPKPEPVGNFATDYLIVPSSTSGRRRPGPSLSSFKDLAKDMKLPSGAR